MRTHRSKSSCLYWLQYFLILHIDKSLYNAGNVLHNPEQFSLGDEFDICFLIATVSPLIYYISSLGQYHGTSKY